MTTLGKAVKFMPLIILSFILFLAIGFSTFYASMTVNNAAAYVVPYADIRVSGFSQSSTENSGSSSGNHHTLNNLYSNLVLGSSTAKVTYAVEITNVGQVEMGILSITGLPNNVKMTTTSYNVGDKICAPNRCANGAVATFYITLEYNDPSQYNANNNSFNINLTVTFSEAYDITYTGLNSTTGLTTSILSGGSKVIEFDSTTGIPTSVSVTGATNSYSSPYLTLSNPTTNVTVACTLANTSNFATKIIDLAATGTGGSSANTDVITVSGGSNCTYTFAYDGTTDNNLRYVGSSPCNYVTFQGITWRIIGVFNNVEVVGESTGQTLVKLISTENYNSSTMAWNSSASNNWLNSTLYSALNTTFYTTNLNSNANVENVKWPLGGKASNAFTPADFYTGERNTGSDNSANTDHNPAGHVGLFYISDYGFATSDRSTCLGTKFNANNWSNKKKTCPSNDWLYTETGSNYFWTMTPNNTTNQVFRIGNAAIGAVVISTSSQLSYVRPVIFLKANVDITSTGNGSSGSPYTLR